MATYVPSLKGYVTDVPEIWLKRRDDKVFHFDQLSSSNVSPDTQFTEVNGGWSLYPVAYLPGQSTMEMTFESAQFDADLFALASNTEFKEEDAEVWGTANIAAESDEQAEYEVESDRNLTGATFYVNGFKATAAVAGALSGNSSSTDDNAGDDTGDNTEEEEPTYNRITGAALTGSPKEHGWYEGSASEKAATDLTDDDMEEDTSITEAGTTLDGHFTKDAGTDKYEAATGTSLEGVTYYVRKDDTFTLSNDTEVNSEKRYYEKVGGDSAGGDSASNEVSGTGVHSKVGLEVEASEQNASTGTFLTRVKLLDATGIKKGDEVVISYCYTQTASTIHVDNQQTFVGEAILKWPVYSSGEEIKAAGVKGYVLMHIYKCRCTAMPGFDTSYKSAVTNGITLSAMDPHRAGGEIYSISFIEKGA